jgi:hypothetical protein
MLQQIIIGYKCGLRSMFGFLFLWETGSLSYYTLSAFRSRKGC